MKFEKFHAILKEAAPPSQKPPADRDDDGDADDFEVNDETHSLKGKLYHIAKEASAMHDMIEYDDDVDDELASKIIKAAQLITDVHNHLDYVNEYPMPGEDDEDQDAESDKPIGGRKYDAKDLEDMDDSERNKKLEIGKKKTKVKVEESANSQLPSRAEVEHKRAAIKARSEGVPHHVYKISLHNVKGDGKTHHHWSALDTHHNNTQHSMVTIKKVATHHPDGSVHYHSGARKGLRESDGFLKGGPPLSKQSTIHNHLVSHGFKHTISGRDGRTYDHHDHGQVQVKNDTIHHNGKQHTDVHAFVKGLREGWTKGPIPKETPRKNNYSGTSPKKAELAADLERAKKEREEKAKTKKEANTYATARAKFNKHNDAELDHMIKRKNPYKNYTPADAHKEKRHGQAKNAAYGVMLKHKPLPEEEIKKEGWTTKAGAPGHVKVGTTSSTRPTLNVPSGEPLLGKPSSDINGTGHASWAAKIAAAAKAKKAEIQAAPKYEAFGVDEGNGGAQHRFRVYKHNSSEVLYKGTDGFKAKQTALKAFNDTGKSHSVWDHHQSKAVYHADGKKNEAFADERQAMIEAAEKLNEAMKDDSEIGKVRAKLQKHGWTKTRGDDRHSEYSHPTHGTMGVSHVSSEPDATHYIKGGTTRDAGTGHAKINAYIHKLK